MLAEIQVPGNIPIGAALGDKMDQSFFSLSQQASAARIPNASGRRIFGERVDNHLELFAVGPDLTAEDGMDALAQKFEGFISRKDSVSAGSEMPRQSSPVQRNPAIRWYAAVGISFLNCG